MLGMGASLIQSKSPIGAINMYLNGFHFYADDMGRQIEAHHFCHHVNEEFFQCVIYDGNSTDARLIGIEYIVSERIFKSLPDDEKPLWHSHRHETTSGELVMPGIPRLVEHTAIGTLVSTYGKTWHTWQIDRDSALPTGIPQLMMGFTADGQLKPEMIDKRDKELGIQTSESEKSAGSRKIRTRCSTGSGWLVFRANSAAHACKNAAEEQIWLRSEPIGHASSKRAEWSGQQTNHLWPVADQANVRASCGTWAFLLNAEQVQLTPS